MLTETGVWRCQLLSLTTWLGMGVDPQEKSRGDPPLHPLPPSPQLPLEVRPLNPARESGGTI